jgi:hypothetical protein
MAFALACDRLPVKHFALSVGWTLFTFQHK